MTKTKVYTAPTRPDSVYLPPPLFVTRKGCRSEFQDPPIKSFTSKIEDKTYGIKTHLVEEFKQLQISRQKIAMAFLGNST
jgi:hypothetical protein